MFLKLACQLSPSPHENHRGEIDDIFPLLCSRGKKTSDEYTIASFLWVLCCFWVAFSHHGHEFVVVDPTILQTVSSSVCLMVSTHVIQILNNKNVVSHLHIIFVFSPLLTLSASTSETISLMSLPSFIPNSRSACCSSSIVMYLIIAAANKSLW